MLTMSLKTGLTHNAPIMTEADDRFCDTYVDFCGNCIMLEISHESSASGRVISGFVCFKESGAI